MSRTKQSADERSASGRLPRFARVVAAMTFLLIIAGALVTGNKAALADPTWPQFIGRWYPTLATFVAGVRFEDTHRVLAGLTAILTLTLAIWTARSEPRAWVRKLAWWALAAVAAQAAVGGVIIRFFRPDVVSIIHACLAQAFFCIVLTVAVVMGEKWTQAPAQITRPGNSSLRSQCITGTSLVYLQLLVGAGIRHATAAFMWHLAFHVLLAFGVIAMLLWLLARILNEYRDIRDLRRMAHSAVGLAAVQILLGVGAIFANRARQADASPDWHHVLVSTAHVATGALILASTLVLTLRAHRLLAPSPAEQRDRIMEQPA